MICVSLGIIDFPEALKLAEKSAMVEFRGDLLDWTREEYAMILGLPKKSLFTFRPSETKSDDERLDIYRFAIENRVDFVDVEMEASPEFMNTIRQYLKNSKTELIISYHDFDGTPSVAELKVIMDQCATLGADVIKIATMVNEYSDAAGLLSLYREPGRKVILGMGEKGKIVRVASVLLGAEFTFAAPERGVVTAPGQMSIWEMEQIFNIINPI